MSPCKPLSGTTTTNNRVRQPSKTTCTTLNLTTPPLTLAATWCPSTKKSCLSTTPWSWKKNSSITSITLKSLPRTLTRQAEVSSAAWCWGARRGTSTSAMKEISRHICDRLGTETWARWTSKRTHVRAATYWSRTHRRELKVKREWCSNIRNRQLIILSRSRTG